MHDCVRDTVRAALMKARPAPQFTTEIHAHATASSGLTPGARDWDVGSELASGEDAGAARAFHENSGYENAGGGFSLQAVAPLPVSSRFQFEGGIAVEANAAIPVARGLESHFAERVPDNGCGRELDVTDNDR